LLAPFANSVAPLAVTTIFGQQGILARTTLPRTAAPTGHEEWIPPADKACVLWEFVPKGHARYQMWRYWNQNACFSRSPFDLCDHDVPGANFPHVLAGHRHLAGSWSRHPGIPPKCFSFAIRHKRPPATAALMFSRRTNQETKHVIFREVEVCLQACPTPPGITVPLRCLTGQVKRRLQTPSSRAQDTSAPQRTRKTTGGEPCSMCTWSRPTPMDPRQRMRYLPSAGRRISVTLVDV